MFVIARFMAALAVASTVALAAAAAPNEAGFTGRPRVTDGDTLTFSVRLFGIDTPEKRQRCRNAAGQCYDCGLTASRAVKRMISHRNVTCEPTGDMTYGRLVAICTVGGRDLNEEILESGLGVAYRRYLDREPSKRSAYLAAEADAKRHRRGLWQGAFVVPSRWRNRGERVAGCE